MEDLTLLNIPNYYSSYYLYGLSKCSKITYLPVEEFKKWNGWPFLILKKGSKIIVIDNADPVCVRQELYDESHIYFATNKLREKEEYQQPKIVPLYPHYPVNCWKTFLLVFGKYLFSEFGGKKALKEMYFVKRRPDFKHYKNIERITPYIFFAGSIWKKEEQANLVRAQFIRAVKQLENTTFEGGLIGRSDGNNQNYEDVLSYRKYSPREFSSKSANSLVAFNNPAVLGAVSWRFAEYMNMGCPILSLPWEIEMPTLPIHGKEIQMVKNLEELEQSLQYLIKNPEYRQNIARGGKSFFDKNCTPLVQAKNILDKM